MIANETVMLKCTAHGYPQPTISWLHNEEVLNGIIMYVATEESVIDDITVESILIRSNMQIEHAGTYTCEVINTVGITGKDVEIDVIGKLHNLFIVNKV